MELGKGGEQQLEEFRRLCKLENLGESERVLTAAVKVLGEALEGKWLDQPTVLGPTGRDLTVALASFLLSEPRFFQLVATLAFLDHEDVLGTALRDCWILGYHQGRAEGAAAGMIASIYRNEED